VAFLLLVDSQSAFSANGFASEKQIEIRWSELSAFLAGATSLVAAKPC